MKILLILSLLGLTSCLMTRADVDQAENDKRMQEQVLTLQKDKADQGNQLADVNEQLRQMSGRIETLENQLAVTTKEKKNLEEKSSKEIADRDQKLAILQEAIEKQEAQIAAIQNDLSSKNKKNEEKPKGTNPFVSAEALFKQKEWKEAILNYQKYTERFPKGKFVAEANYKMGVSFLELGMNDEAKTFFEDVLTRFPSTDAAKAAKLKMKKIK